MIITAKFASTCPCCSALIAIGSKVEWSKGAKAMHVACVGKPAAAAVTATRSTGRSYARRSRGARYCEGWGADNPHAPRPNGTCQDCAGEDCY